MDQDQQMLQGNLFFVELRVSKKRLLRRYSDYSRNPIIDTPFVQRSARKSINYREIYG